MPHASSTIKNINQNKPLAVSFQWLLGLYAIIPLCLLLQGLDTLFLERRLLANLPSSPSHFLLFQLLFGTPHILASSVLLLTNRPYLQFYRQQLGLMTVVIIAVFGVGSLFIPYTALYVVTACWTVYHVLKQQLGVGRGVCRLPNPAFYTLLWLSVSAGILIYLGIFLQNSLDEQQTHWIKIGASALSLMLFIATAIFHQRVTGGLGKIFLWVNTVLVIASLYLYWQQYYFLAILMPRLIHDATAYTFYLTHDYNKHQSQPQNGLYHYAARCKVPIFGVLPLLSVGLTFFLQSYGDALVSFITEVLFGIEINKAVTLGLIGYLSLMHYYSEAFIWKNGSPLRQFIVFKQ